MVWSSDGVVMMVVMATVVVMAVVTVVVVVMVAVMVMVAGGGDGGVRGGVTDCARKASLSGCRRKHAVTLLLLHHQISRQISRRCLQQRAHETLGVDGDGAEEVVREGEKQSVGRVRLRVKRHRTREQDVRDHADAPYVHLRRVRRGRLFAMGLERAISRLRAIWGSRVQTRRRLHRLHPLHRLRNLVVAGSSPAAPTLWLPTFICSGAA